MNKRLTPVTGRKPGSCATLSALALAVATMVAGPMACAGEDSTASNPCAAKKTVRAANPCSAKSKKAENPCAPKKKKGENPCAAKKNSD